MDFALTEQQELIRKEVATLARSFPADYWLEKDKSGDYPWEFVKAFGAGGWLGIVIPEEYGAPGSASPRRPFSSTRSARPAREPPAPRRSTSTAFRRCRSSSTAARRSRSATCRRSPAATV